MNKRFLVFTTFLFLVTIFAQNPGLVTVVKKEIIDQARDKYFQTVIGLVGHQVIPNVDEGHLRVSNIRIDLSNPSATNLQTGFRKDINAISVSIKQTNINVAVDWKYKKAFVSESGNAKIFGTLNGISMDIVMTKMAEGPYFIPQISTQNTQVDFDRGAFKLDFNCHHCPGEVEKWIKDVLKHKILDQVKNQIQSQVPAQVNQIGNANLSKLYPRALSLYDGIDIATGLTDVIAVQDDHLEVLVDATVFPHDQGYTRTEEAGDIPHYNANDPGEIMLFIGKYLIDSLSTTINAGVQVYTTTILGFTIEATLDPSIGETSITFEEGDFIISATPTIKLSALEMGIQFGATAKLNPQISNGDDVNMFSVLPQIEEITLSSLMIVTPGDSYDLTIIMDYLNSVLLGFLNTFMTAQIPIKKLALLPLHVTKSELDFHVGYSELGLLFELSHQ